MDYSKVKGFLELTENHRELFIDTSRRHISAVGNDYKKATEPASVWIDSAGVLCVRVRRGDWFRYYSNKTWG